MSLTGNSAVVLWAGLATLLVISRALGSAARRMGQPPVVGALVAGLLLGPSGLGLAWPRASSWLFPPAGPAHDALQVVSQLSLLALVVALGSETDLPLMRSLGRQTAAVGAASIVIPFAAGVTLGYLLPATLLGSNQERLPFALLLGGAISVTSLPVVARIVDELDLARRNLGQLALAVATVNDVYGFALLAVGAALAGGGGSGRLALSLGGGFLAAVALVVLGQRLVDDLLRRARRRGPNVPASLTIMLVTALVMAAVTQALQVEAALGAFAAGVVLARSRFQQSQAVAHLESWTTALFAPLYFATAGLQANLKELTSAPLVASLVAVVAVSAISKFLGAWVGGLASGLPRAEGAALGVVLNGRGAMQVIIGSAALSLGVFSRGVYSVVLLTSIFTSAAAPSLLTRIVRSWPGTEEEQARLSREEVLDTNVVVRGQRLLLVGRDLSTSMAAASVVNAAWPESSEVTLLAPDGHDRSERRRLENLLRTTLSGRPIRWAEPRASGEITDAVISEANLGYGVIAISADGPIGPNGHAGSRGVLSPQIDDLLNRSPLPVLLVRPPLHRSAKAAELRAVRHIVVPVTGSATSRAGQEVADNISRRTDANLELVHVLTRPGLPSSGEGRPRRVGVRETVDAVLDEAMEIARSHGVSARPQLRVGRSSAEEIESVVAEAHADLVVLGASVRRVANRPFLGHTVQHVLEHVEQATVVVVVVPEVAKIGADEHIDRTTG
jgi:Kef-type K+ transport system membrane component KefB/nucleotide-binding universal stress UspA family protein